MFTMTCLCYYISYDLSFILGLILSCTCTINSTIKEEFSFKNGSYRLKILFSQHASVKEKITAFHC